MGIIYSCWEVVESKVVGSDLGEMKGWQDQFWMVIGIIGDGLYIQWG